MIMKMTFSPYTPDGINRQIYTQMGSYGDLSLGFLVDGQIPKMYITYLKPNIHSEIKQWRPKNTTKDTSTTPLTH